MFHIWDSLGACEVRTFDGVLNAFLSLVFILEVG